MNPLYGLVALFCGDSGKRYAAFAIILVALAGFGSCQTLRLRWQAEKHADLLKEYGSLMQTSNLLNSALDNCRAEAAFGSKLVIDNLERKKELDASYAGIRREIIKALESAAKQELNAKINPHNPGEAQCLQKTPSPTATSSLTAPGNINKETHEVTFQEWSTQPVPDFVSGLLNRTAPAPATIPGNATARPAN